MKRFAFTRIEHKFLERGHTFNENDSMHSTIETALKRHTVYETSQLATVTEGTCHVKTYHVTEIMAGDFSDFKDLSTQARNIELTSDGEEVKWTQIHLLSIDSTSPNTVKILYDYGGDARYLNLFPATRKKQKLPKLLPLFQANDHPLLSKGKYEDLQSLCSKHIIPKAHHSFYESHPHMKWKYNTGQVF